MDLVSFIPGVGPNKQFTAGNATPSAYVGPHTGMTDGTGVANASLNMAEVYNRILLQIAATIQSSGLTVNNNNWAQLADAVAAIAQAKAQAAVGAGYVTAANYATDFGSNKITNGYQKISGGLILQWGRVDGWTNEVPKTVLWPLSFPNACLNASATINNSAGDNGVDQGAQVVGFTASNFTSVIGSYGGGTSRWPMGLFFTAVGF